MEKQDVFFNIDEITHNSSCVVIRGWVFSKRGKVDLFLKNVKSYRIERMFRPDVSVEFAYRERIDVSEDCGFKIIIDNYKLNYISIYVTDGVDTFEIKQRLKSGLAKRIIKSCGGVKLYKQGTRRLKNFSYFFSEYGFKYAALLTKVTLGNLGKGTDYSWYKKFLMNSPSNNELEEQKKHNFKYAPLISLVVLIEKNDVKNLKKMIKSLLHQTYSNWELCIIDTSNEVEWTRVLKNNSDSRIRIKSNISLDGSNSLSVAVQLSKGRYIALLKENIFLTCDALYEIVKYINENRKAELIYTDNDDYEVDSNILVNPKFKPDFSPEFLESTNYIGPFCVITREIFLKLNGINMNYHDAFDYDLYLRISLETKNIAHIPKVLYHCSFRKHCTTESDSSMLMKHNEGAKVLEKYLLSKGCKGVVKDGANGKLLNSYKIDYEVKKELVSIIIPNYNHKADLEKCLNSIFGKTQYPLFEILVVENNSTDNEIFSYYEEIEKKENVRVIRWPGIFNYAAINNWAATQAKGKYLLFLNNDVEIISPNWIEGLIMYAQFKQIGVVGGKLYYPDNTIQHAGVTVGVGSIAGHSHRGADRDSFGYLNRLVLTQNVSAVTGAMMLVRKDVFDAVCGFDEGFVVAYNDVDLCLRIHKSGYRNVFTPEVEAWHYESKSRGSDEENIEKKKRYYAECSLFYKRWGKFSKDEYYNVNLTLEKEDFSLNSVLWH